MTQNRLLTLSIVIIALIIGIYSFFVFMTYDRNYCSYKEYQYEITKIAEKQGFTIVKTDNIHLSKLKRPLVKSLKIRIQNALSNIHLMKYGHEFGEAMTFTSDSSPRKLNCKAWCLNDHLVDLEIEYANIDERVLNALKCDFEQLYTNHKIIWTAIN